MSDLFHKEIPVGYISKVVEVMRLARWHTYQVLTKRSGRMRQLLSGHLSDGALDAHIWWGVSVEDRKHGLPRIDDLQATPAVTRFLSIEPLLEDLGDLSLDGISWVIVGGESGPGARPMRKEWVERIQEQCLHNKVAFFFKQWGGQQKKKHGRYLNGRTYDEFPAIPVNPVAGKELRLRYAKECLAETSPLVYLT